MTGNAVSVTQNICPYTLNWLHASCHHVIGKTGWLVWWPEFNLTKSAITLKPLLAMTRMEHRARLARKEASGWTMATAWESNYLPSSTTKKSAVAVAAASASQASDPNGSEGAQRAIRQSHVRPERVAGG